MVIVNLNSTPCLYSCHLDVLFLPKQWKCKQGKGPCKQTRKKEDLA